MSDWLPWSIKRNTRKPEKYKGIALKAWTFEFTPAEINENWNDVLRRKKILENAVKYYTPENPEPIPLGEVNGRRPRWMCIYCVHREGCYARVEK